MAYLVSPTNKAQKLAVGNKMDCARSTQVGSGPSNEILTMMDINIPSTGLPCQNGKCVLQWTLEAHHVGPPYEQYGSSVCLLSTKDYRNMRRCHH